jgi:hypothetical protein
MPLTAIKHPSTFTIAFRLLNVVRHWMRQRPCQSEDGQGLGLPPLGLVVCPPWVECFAWANRSQRMVRAGFPGSPSPPEAARRKPASRARAAGPPRFVFRMDHQRSAPPFFMRFRNSPDDKVRHPETLLRPLEVREKRHAESFTPCHPPGPPAVSGVDLTSSRLGAGVPCGPHRRPPARTGPTA